MANWDFLRERLNFKAERKGTLLKVCEVSALKSTEHLDVYKLGSIAKLAI